MRCVHKRKVTETGEEMEVEKFECSSSRCEYTSMYRSDMTKHVAKCIYVVFDREIDVYETRLKEADEFKVHLQHEHQELKTHLQQVREQTNKQFEKAQEYFKIQLQEAQEQIISYRETIGRLQGLQSENELLRQQVDKLHAQLEKAQDGMKDLAEQAINRPPTINNQLTNQIGSVKITNYLTDHQTYVDHTDPDFVMEQAQKFFEKYMVELLNGQRALARFMVDHIIKCPESGRIILCCTDTARKRFIYMNHLNEKEEDMMAKYFLERMSGPIKEVSHTIFEHIVDRLEAQKQTTKGAFELADIDHRIQTVTTKYLEIRDFDIDDKNSDFLVELAALLRGPKEITDGKESKGDKESKDIKSIEHKTDS